MHCFAMGDALETKIKYYALRTGIVPTLGVAQQADGPAVTEATSHIYVLAGQSNMVGRGDPAKLPEDLVAEVKDRTFLCYDHDKNFAEKLGGERATSSWKPLSHDAQYSYGGQCHHFGPEFSLARTLLERTPGNLYFAKFAMGSTNLHADWRPDGRFFADFVRFVKDALASAPHPSQLCGVFWLQGESDSTGNSTQVNSYEDNLAGFFSRLRQELDMPRLPVVASQVDFHCGPQSKGKRPKKMSKINEAIRAACARDDLQPAECSLLEGEMSMHEDGHLDSAALLEMGSRMGDAFSRLAQRL